MKIFLSILSLMFFISCKTSSDEGQDKSEIKAILMKQQQAWSNNDIEGFMDGYWKSDSLKFYSGTNLSNGWRNTLDNYKARYPNKAHSGRLEFTIADITQINTDSYWVMGEYHLFRDVGDANGTFLIIFKRINGEWKIVADSSC